MSQMLQGQSFIFKDRVAVMKWGCSTRAVKVAFVRIKTLCEVCREQFLVIFAPGTLVHTFQCYGSVEWKQVFDGKSIKHQAERIDAQEKKSNMCKCHKVICKMRHVTQEPNTFVKLTLDILAIFEAEKEKQRMVRFRNMNAWKSAFLDQRQPSCSERS